MCEGTADSNYSTFAAVEKGDEFRPVSAKLSVIAGRQEINY